MRIRATLPLADFQVGCNDCINGLFQFGIWFDTPPRNFATPSGLRPSGLYSPPDSGGAARRRGGGYQGPAVSKNRPLVDGSASLTHGPQHPAERQYWSNLARKCTDGGSPQTWGHERAPEPGGLVEYAYGKASEGRRTISPGGPLVSARATPPAAPDQLAAIRRRSRRLPCTSSSPRRVRKRHGPAGLGC